jgi:hypothetical protein
MQVMAPFANLRAISRRGQYCSISTVETPKPQLCG